MKNEGHRDEYEAELGIWKRIYVYRQEGSIVYYGATTNVSVQNRKPHLGSLHKPATGFWGLDNIPAVSKRHDKRDCCAPVDPC